MSLDVNGQRRQTGSTSTMIFSMAKCISYVSQFLTLLPGDIVTTGTPPGVGTGMKPPQFLMSATSVTLGIEGSASSARDHRGVSCCDRHRHCAGYARHPRLTREESRGCASASPRQ
jgi:2-keto-4-pentenoate hydratase/2-oxohepta-3-ene-1,7-dioic acid hydratase in catechol pathway